jgi:hypothetical protein
MLYSINNLLGYSVEATDGSIGKIDDFYFDDQTWGLRYLVVDVSTWLFGRKVLLAPQVIVMPFEHSLVVRVTKQQVKESPDINTKNPFSRQHEKEIHQHFGWPFPVEGMPGAMPPPIIPPLTENETVAELEKGYDRHLRSTNWVNGYDIRTLDGFYGIVDDFVIDDEPWQLRFVVGISGLEVKNLVPVSEISQISWPEKTALLNLTMDAMHRFPVFDPEQHLKHSYGYVLGQYFS